VQKSGDHDLDDGDFVDIPAKSYDPAGLENGESLLRNVADKLKVFCAPRDGPRLELAQARLCTGIDIVLSQEESSSTEAELFAETKNKTRWA
jgi:hypothetical protein